MFAWESVLLAMCAAIETVASRMLTIEPTHTTCVHALARRYKAAEGSAIVKKLKSIKKKDKKGSEPAAAAAKDTKPAATAEAAAHDELRGMVAKLKRKGAQAQEAQAAKKARK